MFTGHGVVEARLLPQPRHELGIAADDVGEVLALVKNGHQHFRVAPHGGHEGPVGARVEAHLEITVHPHDDRGGIRGVPKRLRQRRRQGGLVVAQDGGKTFGGFPGIAELDVLKLFSHGVPMVSARAALL